MGNRGNKYSPLRHWEHIGSLRTNLVLLSGLTALVVKEQHANQLPHIL